MALLSKKLFTANQSVKTLLVRVVILVVLVGAQFWLWQLVKDRVNDFQQKRFQAQQIEDLNNRINQIKQNQKNQQELLSQLDLIVPTKSSLAQIIERLERVASDRSVRLKISSIKEDQASSGSATPTLPVSPVTFSAQVTGTAQQLLQYLDSIEHLQELTVVPTWSITSTTQNGANPTGAAASPAPSQSAIYTMSFDITFWLQTTTHAKQK